MSCVSTLNMDDLICCVQILTGHLNARTLYEHEQIVALNVHRHRKRLEEDQAIKMQAIALG